MKTKFIGIKNLLYRVVTLVRSSAVLKAVSGLFEALFFGTRLRLALVDALTAAYHSSDFRRRFIWQIWGEPHFTDVKGVLHSLYRGKAGLDVYSLTRAFAVMEVLNEGDVVLDIGCGNGGLTKRFLAPKAGHIDALDIEKSAIDCALKDNASPKIKYFCCDAINDAWPSMRYNLIVLDGALGHFSSADNVKLLRRISTSLVDGGVFCGSESLGNQEGHDHLQYFSDAQGVKALLSEYFEHVMVQVVSYPIAHGIKRSEVYWRCSNSQNRLRIWV